MLFFLIGKIGILIVFLLFEFMCLCVLQNELSFGFLYIINILLNGEMVLLINCCLKVGLFEKKILFCNKGLGIFFLICLISFSSFELIFKLFLLIGIILLIFMNDLSFIFLIELLLIQLKLIILLQLFLIGVFPTL